MRSTVARIILLFAVVFSLIVVALLAGNLLRSLVLHNEEVTTVSATITEVIDSEGYYALAETSEGVVIIVIMRDSMEVGGTYTFAYTLQWVPQNPNGGDE